ncbi:hypothetical protein VTG60DRAFT_3807 [Thermothelomyces hinnuleus]
MVGEWGGGVGYLILGVWQGEWAALILLPVNCCAWAKPGNLLELYPPFACPCWLSSKGILGLGYAIQEGEIRQQNVGCPLLPSPPLPSPQPRQGSRSWRRVWLSAVTLNIFQQTMLGSMIAQSSVASSAIRPAIETGPSRISSVLRGSPDMRGQCRVTSGSLEVRDTTWLRILKLAARQIQVQGTSPLHGKERPGGPRRKEQDEVAQPSKTLSLGFPIHIMTGRGGRRGWCAD